MGACAGAELCHVDLPHDDDVNHVWWNHFGGKPQNGNVVATGLFAPENPSTLWPLVLSGRPIGASRPVLRPTVIEQPEHFARAPYRPVMGSGAENDAPRVHVEAEAVITELAPSSFALLTIKKVPGEANPFPLAFCLVE